MCGWNSAFFALALVVGRKLEDVGRGPFHADGQGAEIVHGGNPDHAGVHRVKDAGQEADADAVAQLGIIKAQRADFLEHRAAIDVALRVPATGKRIHKQKAEC